MDAREKSARESGGIRLFLHPEQIGLLLASLTWVKVGMATAEAHLGRLEGSKFKDKLPDGLFAHLVPALDGARDALLIDAFTDAGEHGGTAARSSLQATVDSSAEDIEMIQKAAAATQRELYSTIIAAAAKGETPD